MKKQWMIVGICTLLIGMPMAMATPMPQMENIKIDGPTDEKPIHPLDDPPSWATGNFSGVWGLDIWGETHIPLGWLYGYYKRTVHFGYFYAAFADFWSENETNFLQGFLIGPYMLGTLGSNESANETAFVGLGGYNETHFYWRVMGMEGPTFFMYGVYSKYDD
jgi:hypothetical protein